MVRVADLFPGWVDEGELGAGSYGTVKLAAKEVGGVTMRRAVKLVLVPRDSAEVEAVRRATGKTDEALRSYFEFYAHAVMSEVAAMEGLRSCPQVVNVYDCQMVPDTDGVSWVVGIMMELLEPIDALMSAGPAGQAEVARVGADVARALEACHAQGIVHRDVKPSNVLSDGRGIYKLGDFGIARVVDEGTTSELSRRGTPAYMAPEEVRGEGYGSSVDLYALGVMLYRMLNGGRQPFLEVDPLNATPRDLQRAEMRRLSGEPFSAISGVDPSLMSMVLRMCDADPAMRPSASEARAELEACVVALMQTISASKAAQKSASAPRGSQKKRTAKSDAYTVLLPGGTVRRPTPMPAPSRSGDAPADPVGDDAATVPAPDDTWRVGQVSAPTEPLVETAVRESSGSPDESVARKGSGRQYAQASEKKGTSNRGATARPKSAGRKILKAIAIVCAIAVVALSAWGITNALNGDGSASVTSDVTDSVVEANDGDDDAAGTTSDAASPVVETEQEGQPEQMVNTVGHRSLLEGLSGGLFYYRENEEPANFATVSAGFEHAIFLRSDGTVLAVGRDSKGQCDVSDWTDVIAVSAGKVHSVGLRSDGTVVAAGENKEGECDVSSWSDVVAVATGYQQTIGLRSDGTILTAGHFSGDYDFSGWTDIVAIAGADYHVVGLRSDGTVLATGSKYFGRTDVSDWSDIVAVSAGLYSTVGLRSDGTVVAAGSNEHGQCDVSGWTDIVEVAAGGFHTVGLRSDGTVMAVGSESDSRTDVSGWADVEHIAAGTLDTFAVRSDGTLLQCGPSSKYYKFASE